MVNGHAHGRNSAMGDTDGKRGVVRAREATGATREERRGRGRNDAVVPLRKKEKVPARGARRGWGGISADRVRKRGQKRGHADCYSFLVKLQSRNDRFASRLLRRRDFAENGIEGAEAERLVVGDRYPMVAWRLGLQ